MARETKQLGQETDFVETGGVIAYGVNCNDLSCRAATYVDKILKGRTPADRPVEPPMNFKFIINLKSGEADRPHDSA